ncbi:MAG: ribbon-helix-helix domain-containing protein [Thermoproteota archaeon]|nr:ribbon-helix-helix domain-containing protein [Thermoproteota archaeon]
MVLTISVTLPEPLIERIDKERGDINRSKYVLRLLERAYQKDRDGLAKNSEGQKGR